MKRLPAIAPYVEGADLKEYSAHLIPEGGVAMMPKMTMDGMLVAGDAAALCLAAGIWLEGVNFAMASGMYAGEAAVEALRAGDASAAGLAGYERRLGSTFVLRDHRRLRRAPELVLSDRVQHLYPRMVNGRGRADVPGRQPHAQAAGAPHPARGASARRDPLAGHAPRLDRLRQDVPVKRRRTATARRRPAPDDSAWSPVSFEERMATAEFRVHERAHIVVDGAVCAECSTRDCVVACPANLFVPTSDGGIVFNYEQCFECGTCYMVCNKEGAISWSYPEGGYGVVFHRT